jgi:hypothetical protein
MSLLNNYTLANGDTPYYALAGSGIPIPGPPGPPGPPGAQGPPGANGNSILSDVVPPTPVVGQTSDLFVDLVTSQLYKKIDPVTWQPEFALIGPAGTAATVAVGVTTTLAPGTPANVNNTGTPQAAVLNFAIPQGIQGIQGIQGPPGSAATASVWSTFPATQVVDLNNNAVANAVLIDAPIGLNLTANGGDIIFLQKNPGSVIKVSGGPLDLSANDIENVGSISTSGIGNTIDFGSVIPPDAPLASFSVLSSEVTMNHLNPLTQMLLRGQGDVRVESVNGDLNLIGDDVNIATTNAANVLNITALGVIQNTAGAAFNITAGGGMGIQAGALISITTPGQINIGSGNVLGATTSIEKVDFSESVISKVSAGGTADLQIQNVLKLSNAGGGTNTLTVEATNAPLTLQGTQTNVTSLSNGNVVIAPQGTGLTIFGTGTAPSVASISAAGVFQFANVPKSLAAPAVGIDITNKTYVDTKIPGNADFTMTNNLAAPAASAASNGPFLYIPSFAGPPTGTPTAIAGATPLYMDISGGIADLYAYVAGVWVAV